MVEAGEVVFFALLVLFTAQHNNRSSRFLQQKLENSSSLPFPPPPRFDVFLLTSVPN